MGTIVDIKYFIRLREKKNADDYSKLKPSKNNRWLNTQSVIALINDLKRPILNKRMLINNRSKKVVLLYLNRTYDELCLVRIIQILT